MTNIEKLYKLANIETTVIGCTNEDIYNSEYYCNDCEGDCIDCTWYDEDEVYPPFTDTKQLKLIKWLDYFSYFPTIGSFHMQFHLKDKQYHKIGFVSFEDTLASLVCELYKDLTDMQKEEIRRILQ